MPLLVVSDSAPLLASSACLNPRLPLPVSSLTLPGVRTFKGGFFDLASGRFVAFSAATGTLEPTSEGCGFAPPTSVITYDPYAGRSVDPDLGDVVVTHFTVWLHSLGSATDTTNGYLRVISNGTTRGGIFFNVNGIGALDFGSTTPLDPAPGWRLGLNSIVLRITDAKRDVWVNGVYSSIGTGASGWNASTTGAMLRTSTAGRWSLLNQTTWLDDVFDSVGPLLSTDPRLIFAPQERRIWVPSAGGGGTGASVALSGAAGAFSAGTVSSTGGASATLSGASSSFAAGTVSAAAGGDAVVALVGASAAFNAGLISGAGGAQILLSGAAGAFTAGVISAVGQNDATVALSGASATFSPGVIGASGGSAGSAYVYMWLRTA